MYILIINGSPRKKGLISQMLGIMQEEAVKRGDTVEMVYTNDLTVKPCTLKRRQSFCWKRSCCRV